MSDRVPLDQNPHIHWPAIEQYADLYSNYMGIFAIGLFITLSLSLVSNISWLRKILLIVLFVPLVHMNGCTLQILHQYELREIYNQEIEAGLQDGPSKTITEVERDIITYKGDNFVYRYAWFQVLWFLLPTVVILYILKWLYRLARVA